MVEGKVFLSILVNEWYLISECWLSLSLVNSRAPKHLDLLAQTFVSQPALWSERGKLIKLIAFIDPIKHVEVSLLLIA